MDDLNDNALEVEMDLDFAPEEWPWSPEPRLQVTIPLTTMGPRPLGVSLQLVVVAPLAMPRADRAGGALPANGHHVPSGSPGGPSE